ncbi:MAG: tetratricopeptide repeat protein, partial [Myxococcota bacterium]
GVPPAPPIPCAVPGGLRDPSNAQVDAGNDEMVAGRLAVALDRYRAAITLNQCNATAWTALGDGLLQTGNAAAARAALEAATRLSPTHFHAWTSLGAALERTGDRSGAAAAYQRALQGQPGYPPATAGLARVR